MISEETRAKLRAAKLGNKNRVGTRHSEESRASISAGNKRAYAEGRHLKDHCAENFRAYNKAVKAGERPHSQSKGEK